ncbi:aromatic prenyltransferase [Streptomyces sp. JJ36]|uniref:aromatic prenyltransferase n=1 Tax=Streptomyces sp. JJ36 TaxID=2736645 RepID=UPI001F28ABC6|nr:aromatic prenyltransferase [Streptomyces sp. JJ36]MCF6523710.1 hypothetical protein [Streptomyces sp. JJ36]
MPTDLVRLVSDLRKYADLAEAPFDEAAVRKVIDIFPDLYAHATIGVRTTNHPVGQRDVNFRYVSDVPHDPVERLTRAGLLIFEGHPIESLLTEVVETFPHWWGLDSAVSHGFEKLWAFFTGGVPLDDILALRHLPESARAHGKHLARFGLDRVFVLGMDFHHRSVNLYSPMQPPGSLSPVQVADMLGDLGLPLPDEEELRHDARAVQYYYTFSWEHARVHRLCFAIGAGPEDFPVHREPLLGRFAAEAPIAGEKRNFIWNTTYGPGAGYLKMESDYTGVAAETVIPMMGHPR